VKKIGIVGGVAWLSTVDYYAGICRLSEQWHLARNPRATSSTPEMSIESLDVSKAISLFGRDGDEESWAQYDEYHRGALQRIEASGADFALMASNTPHHRFASIVRGIRVPVLSIVDVIAKESARSRVTEVLILGTAVTMRSAGFREGFAKHGISAAGPRDDSARGLIVELIAELQLGKIEGAPERIGKVARSCFQGQFDTQPAVCLACTELPLAFPEQKTLPSFSRDGITYLNTVAAHINAAFDLAANG
jgi:aspartate racemase